MLHTQTHMLFFIRGLYHWDCVSAVKGVVHASFPRDERLCSVQAGPRCSLTPLLPSLSVVSGRGLPFASVGPQSDLRPLQTRPQLKTETSQNSPPTGIC